MAISEQIQLALQAYQEVKEELHPDGLAASPLPAFSDIGQVIAGLGPLPQEALLLGLASDGLPVLMDLVDPAPGPVLVLGERLSGKTAFLQSLARQTNPFHDPGDIQFGAITPFPDEWDQLETLPGCLGIWPANHPTAAEFLMRLIGWADALTVGKQNVLLLLDGLDWMTGFSPETRRDLHWLLTHGPERHIWPIVTAEAQRFEEIAPWMDCFHTRIFGHVGQRDLARSLIEDPHADLTALLAGAQFTLHSQEGWLCFSIQSQKGILP